MHECRISFRWYYVPFRIIWPEFEAFITGADSSLVVPHGAPKTPSVSGLLTKMGAREFAGKSYSALPLRAYLSIWNEHYRDRDLQEVVDFSAVGGADVELDVSVQRVNWDRDYFTSARTESQQGDEVQLDIAGESPFTPIMGLRSNTSLAAQNVRLSERNETGFDAVAKAVAARSGSGNDALAFRPGMAPEHVDSSASQNAGSESVKELLDGEHPDSYVGLVGPSGWVAALRDGKVQSATAAALGIRTLREALALQRFAEARAMYGDRYEDLLRFLGVRPQDDRLQHPEYVGGGSARMSFSEVLATDYGTNGENLGRLAGHGVGAVQTRPARRFIPEHGLLMAVACIKPRAIYSNAVHRSFLRRKREDFHQKEFERIGHQAVATREIYGGADDDAVFGYQRRFQEYREHPHYVSGKLLEDANDEWHLARSFSTAPGLNGSFEQCNPPGRSFAISSDPQFIVDNWNDVVAARPIGRPM